MAGPDVLIVGGTGFLGAALVAAAEQQGRSWAATWFGTHRSGSNWHRLDLRSAAQTRALLDALSPTAVINAAYVQNGPDVDALTAEGPAHLAAWTAGRARLLHLSSDLVFDGTPGPPRTEDHPARPVIDYGRAKWRAEQAVLGADHGSVVVRTSLLYPRTGDAGAQIRLVRDPSVRFHTDEIRSPIAVETLAAACLELVDRTEITGVLHVAGADHVDRLTLARHLAPRIGLDPDSLVGRPSGDPTRPSDCALDSTRARSLLATPLPGVRGDGSGD